MAPPDISTETLSVRDAFNVARARHLAGALDQARDIYQRILDVMPDHPDAVIMMASIAFRQGDERLGQTYLDRAIDVTRATIQRMPADLGTRAALVNLLLARGRIAEAETLMPDLDIPLNPMRTTDQEFAARGLIDRPADHFRRHGQILQGGFCHQTTIDAALFVGAAVAQPRCRQPPAA